jgi:hypothetical protein
MPGNPCPAPLRADSCPLPFGRLRRAKRQSCRFVGRFACKSVPDGFVGYRLLRADWKPEAGGAEENLYKNYLKPREWLF